MSSQPVYENVDHYIMSHSGAAREYLEMIRAIIRSEVPGAEEKISYGIPTFTFGGKNLIHYAAFARHAGVYPAPREADEFRDELATYAGGKGTVQFPFNKALPEDLIRRIIRYRLAHHRGSGKRS